MNGDPTENQTLKVIWNFKAKWDKGQRNKSYLYSTHEQKLKVLCRRHVILLQLVGVNFCCSTPDCF